MELFEAIRWRPGISDPTPLGWLTVITYAIVTIICAIYVVRLRSASNTADHKRQVWAWTAITILIFALGVNKQLDLQTLLSQLGREISKTQGWYESRRSVQFVFILAIAAVGTLSIGGLVYSLRQTIQRHWLAFLGLFALLLFVVIRAVSFHYIDLFLYTNIIGDLKLSTGLELGSLILIGSSTYFAVREQSQQSQTSTKSVLAVSGGILAAMVVLAVLLGFLSFLWPNEGDRFEEIVASYQHETILENPTSEPTSFTAEFSQQPSEPTPFRPSSDWDVTIHTRSWQDVETFAEMDAVYGPDCADPAEFHTIERFEDAAYLCNGRLITAISGEGYAAVTLTPNQLIDFSQGIAHIEFDLSTIKPSSRDWVEIWITPYHDHLQIPVAGAMPDLVGYPKEGIQIRLDNSKRFVLSQISDYEAVRISQIAEPYDIVFTAAPENMVGYQVEISTNHIRFGAPDGDVWWADTTFDIPLDWQMGVVQFMHHSFEPAKCDGCETNSWQWDNINISPTRPFTMIATTQRYINRSTGTTIAFNSPAPEQSYLRFMALAEQVQISFDNGETWQETMQAPFQETQSAFQPYWTPIPAGLEQIQIRALDQNGHDWQLRDISIWSLVHSDS